MAAKLICNLIVANSSAFRIFSRNVSFSKFSYGVAPFISQRTKLFEIPALHDVTVRHKGKDRGKEKNKKQGKVEINIKELSEVVNIDKFKEDLETSLQTLQDDYEKHVSIRTAIGSVESIKVNFEDKEYNLQELAQVIRKGTKIIILNMNAFPQAIPSVLQALSSSGMNLNPQQDGTSVFIPTPKVTKEYRERLAKNARALFIKCRDTMKNSNLDLLRKLNKQKDLSEDVVHNIKKQLNAMTEEYVTKAKALNQSKSDELLKLT